jgi:UDP-N-acetylglucosamine 2-epimerase (non-hydrolysing)
VLGIPHPDAYLGVGSGSHAEQTARVMVEFEKVCLERKPRLVLVVGDVNSTMACAITAKKLWIPVAHVEAGLRSGDMRMPEEVNRIVTDALCDLFFTTEPEGGENLVRSGIPGEKIHFAGNVMIDTLLRNRAAAERNGVLEEAGVKPGEYCLLTLHRPSNVDDPEVLGRLLGALGKIQERIRVVFPAHPRTLAMIGNLGFSGVLEGMGNLHHRGPTDYHQTLKLSAHARFVLTDSGGLQEETTALGIPCITLRETTERPITATLGTNEVVGTSPARILDAVDRILAGRWKKGRVPEGWDGRAGERIVAVVEGFLASGQPA